MDLPRLTDEPKHHPDCCISLSTRLLDVLTAAFVYGAPLSGESAAKTVPGPAKKAENARGLVLSIGSGTGLLEALLLARWSNPSLHQGSSGVDNDAYRAVTTVKGIEVRSSINKYLPAANFGVVRGTWDVVDVSRSASRSRELSDLVPDPDSSSSVAAADTHAEPGFSPSNPVHPPQEDADAAAVTGLLFVYPRSPTLVSRYVRALVATLGEDEEEDRGVAVWLGHKSDWPDFEPCFSGVPGLGAVEVLDGGGRGDDEEDHGRDNGLVGYEMMAVVRKGR